MPRTPAPASDDKPSIPADWHRSDSASPRSSTSGREGSAAARASGDKGALERESKPPGATIVVDDAKLTESLMRAMSDPRSRGVMSSAIERGKTIEEMSSELQIPPSTCYRKVRELVDQGAMIAERIVVMRGGKKYTVYRSVFSSVVMKLEKGRTSVQVTINPDADDKLHRARAATN